MEKRVIEFGDFVLGSDGRLKTRDGQAIPVTPKAIQVLRELLNRPGDLVGKSELIDAVWSDSYVEEGNLKFTVSMLRRALGDDAHRPRYIETIPRLGYRFVAPVHISDGSGQSNVVIPKADHPPDGTNRSYMAGVRGGLPWRFGLAGVLIAICVSGLLYSGVVRSKPTGGLLTTPFVSEKLVPGGVPAAAISADSKILVYHLQKADKTGIWLREMDTGTNREILSATDHSYGPLALTADGAFVYFARKRTDSKDVFRIYRMSTQGGIPVEIASGTETRLSLARDGSTISYARCPNAAEDYCSLYVANAQTGGDERRLVTRPKPFRIADNQISPDGKSVAFAAGNSDRGANEFGLYEVDIATGGEKPLAATKFFNIKSIQWLADGSSLLLTALTSTQNTLGIWQVSRPSGEAVRLTRHVENYSGLSIDHADNTLVATIFAREFQIGLVETRPPFERRTVGSAETGGFGADGRLYFSSMFSGNSDVWSMMPDGSGQRQLTNDIWEDVCPVPAPDGSFVAFSSNESGGQHIYRINTDGTGRRRLSSAMGGVPMFISGDGRWVYYRSAIDKTLWRVAAEGGDEALVLDKRADHFAYSPKHGKIAYAGQPAKEIVIIGLEERKQLSTIKIDGLVLAIHWDLTGDAVLCAVRTAANKAELWRYPLDGTSGTLITELSSKQVVDFSQSPDGRQIAIIEGDWQYEAVLIRGLR